MYYALAMFCLETLQFHGELTRGTGRVGYRGQEPHLASGSRKRPRASTQRPEMLQRTLVPNKMGN